MTTFSAEHPAPRPSRRAFLRYAGATTAGTALLLAGCDSSSNDPQPVTNDPDPATIGLGSGQIAQLNLLQATKQISAELYRRVLATPPAGLTAAEQSLLRSIGDHDALHRDALKVIVNTFRAASSAAELSIPALTVNFSTLTLTTREGALRAALQFANLNVSLAAGLVRYYTLGPLLTLTGKILSVDARHAATLADLLTANEVFDPQPNGDSLALNQLRKPSEFIAFVNPYLASGSKLITGSLP